MVLGRKVPLKLWQVFYIACKKAGLKDEDLVRSEGRRAAWLALNKAPRLIQSMLDHVMFQSLGFPGCPLYPHILIDGNVVFNVLSILPNRLVLCIAFCLKYWGQQAYEPWVRLFSTKVVILYLIISRHIQPKSSTLQAAADMNYSGLIELICTDILATRGTRARQFVHDQDSLLLPGLDFLYLFNNSITLLDLDNGVGHGQAPQDQEI